MRYLVVLLSYLLILNTASSEQHFKSSGANNQLIELYTSQGCSSCPPAQRWVSGYTHDKSLWVSTFPVVFHVDYWNYLGWSDPYSQSKFSKRQRTYHSQSAISSVYTPAFIINGLEWRHWYSSFSKPDKLTTSGTLNAIYDDKALSVTYSKKGSYELNVALLINAHTTDVKHGENSGKLLREDFTVTDYYTELSDKGMWTIDLKPNDNNSGYKKAIVIWVNDSKSLKPLQVTGGWLH